MSSNIVIKNRFFDTSVSSQIKDEEGNQRTLINYVDYLSRKEACDRTNLEKVFVSDIIVNIEGSKSDSSFFNEFGDVEINVVKDDLRSVMKRGGIVWDMVISLKDYEYAKINELKSKIDYKEFAKECMSDLFANEKFNPAYTRWAGVLHTNTEHPHMHVVFYEKNKKHFRKKGVIRRKHINKMKLKLNSILIKDYSEFASEREMKNSNQQELINELLSSKETNENIQKMYKHLLLSFPNRKIDFNSESFINYKTELNALVNQGLSLPGAKEKYEELLKQLNSMNDYLDTFIDGVNYKESQDEFLKERVSRIFIKEILNDRKENRMNEMNTNRLLKMSNHALNDIQFELNQASSNFLNQK